MFSGGNPSCAVLVARLTLRLFGLNLHFTSGMIQRLLIPSFVIPVIKLLRRL
jgi:hypothetical protein